MRQWSHYTIADKQAVLAALAAGTSARAIERETGIDHHLVASWRNAYEHGGETALHNYRHTRRYSPALKAQVVAEYRRGGTSLRKLSIKYNISSPSLCSKWVAAADIDK